MTPAQLAEIRARHSEGLIDADIPALLAEVERLRSRIEYFEAICRQTAVSARRALDGGEGKL